MLRKYLVSPSKTVRETISYMEENGLKAVLITTSDNVLLGLFSLGDIRHFFLRNGKLSSSITEAMNADPIVFSSLSEAEIRRKSKKLTIYPIVDEKRRIINVIDPNSTVSGAGAGSLLGTVPVVIMAGGKGTRLYPYTKILPKALIPIGEYTITERIISSFQQYGCKSFYMILNHRASIIKSYFNEIEKNYEMVFEEEKEFLGTGGGLALLKGKIKCTFFLSNCDILINADLERIYKMHKQEKNKITFVCAMKDMAIPYGVIQADADGKVIEIKEKPEISFLANTGVYLIEPEVIDGLDEKEFIHLPDIAQRYLARGERIGVFPISDKLWLDMGQFNEMESMMNQLGV